MESGNLLKILQELTYRTRITFKVSSSEDVLLQAKQKDADQTEMLTRWSADIDFLKILL